MRIGGPLRQVLTAVAVLAAAAGGVVAAQAPAQAAGTPHTRVAAPDAAVGALSSSDNPNDHHCTASIVDSPKGNVIVTAAHCVYGKSTLAFSPGYHDGQAPYGSWRAVSAYVYDGWKSSNDINGAGSPYDYAFVVLENHNGQSVANATGSALRLRTNPGLPQEVTSYGYPSTGNTRYEDKPYVCDSTATADGLYWETQQCAGIPGGWSGGPWIAKGTRDVFGVIGGKGQNLPDTDPRNYSVRFDGRAKELLDKAGADTNTANPPTNGNLGYQLGGGGTWKHANYITAGYYTGGSQGGSRHMDMLVVWSDGEVTLYQGSTSTDPQRPFVGETRLAAPGGLWTHATGIASANSGGGQDGVVVKWSDGELTLYKTVDQGGFHDELQLAAPNDLWRDHASLITVGSFGSGKRDDLVVVWNDGEVSLYSDVAGNKLGAETKLQSPNGTWTHAQTITSGDYTGNNNHDLLVRWSDGELTLYPDIDKAGFHGEKQIQAPNSLWTHATVIAGGAFAGNKWPTDLIVRWSDGEVSLYPDADANGLHAEIQLVNPNGSPGFTMVTPDTPPPAPAPVENGARKLYQFDFNVLYTDDKLTNADPNRPKIPVRLSVKAGWKDAEKVLRDCFNCVFPVGGAPKEFPSNGQFIPLKACVGGVCRDAPLKAYLDPDGYHFVTLPGHFDGPDSTVKFRFYSDGNGWLHLEVTGWVTKPVLPDVVNMNGARYMWNIFADNLGTALKQRGCTIGGCPA